MKKLIAVVAALAALGYGASQAYAWVSYQVGTPVSGASRPVAFTIQPGEGATEVAQALQSKGLIRSAEVFQLYLRFTGQRGSIQAGQYVLNQDMTFAQIARALQHGRGQQVSVTIPEGYTARKTADLVQQSGIGSAQAYLEAERDPSWKAQYKFLAGLGAGRDLEGYLFPDTYFLAQHATPRDLVKKQLDEFARLYDSGLAAAAALPVAGARPAEPVDLIVILASIVEREANRSADRPLVCDVYYNRLARGMPLQADATVLYAEGVWKKQVLDQDLQFPSPYNTYLHSGPPPGPISNPGRASIQACLHPSPSSYLYYFTDPHGKTHFAATLEEFNRAKSQYGVG